MKARPVLHVHIDRLVLRGDRAIDAELIERAMGQELATRVDDAHAATSAVAGQCVGKEVAAAVRPIRARTPGGRSHG